MARRPKTIKEKIFVAIKKSDEPLSKLQLQLKLKVSEATIERNLPQLLELGCIEKAPSYYSDILAMTSGERGLKKRPSRKVHFYRTTKDHSCKFCEVF